MRLFRVIFSILFFFLYFLLFLRILESFPLLGNLLPGFQILPGILKALAAFSIASFIALFLLAVTALSGRWYCSALCPLGTLQDIFIFIKKKLVRRKAFRYHKPASIVQYILFAASIGLFAAGWMTLFVWIEPLSVFGRITVNLIRPVFNFVNNNLSFALYHIGITALRPMTDYQPEMTVFLISIIFLASLGLLAFFRGRLYCNLICPTGAILGLLSRLPFFRFRIRKDKCTGCGLCEEVCRSECIDSFQSRIDVSRCVNCLDCRTVCPKGAIFYGWDQTRSVPPENKNSRTRRDFISTSLKTVALGFSIILLPKKIGASVYTKFLPFRKKEAVMPPGAMSRTLFTGRCTACNLCVAVCPNQIIRSSVFEYGLPFILQPMLDYDRGYCLFECKRCTEVCPTGALKTLTLPEKEKTQIGQAHLIKGNCIVYQKELPCIACSEHCPTKAVDAYPYKKKGLYAPEVDVSVCVGCGACENVCPARPKAIYVEGNVIHSTANKKIEKKPIEDKKALREKAAESDDFPF